MPSPRPWLCAAAFSLLLVGKSGLSPLYAGEPLSLEPNSRETAKRLNETLTRAGFPGLQIGDAKGRVAVVLSPAAAKEALAAPDQVRSPLNPSSLGGLENGNDESTAKARGIKERLDEARTK